MRIETKEGQLCIVLEHSGEIAKVLLAMQYYNGQHADEVNRQFSARLMSVLEDELV